MTRYQKLPMLGRVLVPLFLVVLGIGAYRVSSTSGAVPTIEGSSGTLTVDGVDYEFATTTCLISAEDFVAAGTGVHGQDQFWVSASGWELDLSIGTTNEVDRPADDQLWLTNQEPVEWWRSGETVVAAVPMADQRIPEAPVLPASLSLRCADV